MPVQRLRTYWVPRIPVLCVVLLLAACGGNVSDGSDAVVIGMLGDPQSLNPLVASTVQAQDVINLVFLKLLVEEADFLGFRPRLAERWAFGEDSLAITFYLRRDVLWQDGEPVTSEDVRYTWELQTDSLVAWSSRHLKDQVADVEVVDDHTVTFHFTGRYPNQLKDANDGVILPKHVLEQIPREVFRTSEFGRNPTGCGPFKLTRWVAGQYVELERNANYYERGKPYLDRVVFRIVPDMTTLVTQLKTGEIDCLESLPMDALPQLQEDYPNIRIYRYLSRGITFVAWNLENELFEDGGIRRALAMAVNVPEMIETLWKGMARQANSPMHPMLWAHDPSLEAIPYNPDQARAILKSHGWIDGDGDGVLERDGLRFEFEMTTNQGIQVRADVLTMVQEYLRRIGVKVNARVLEWNTFINGVITGEFESCVLGWQVSTRADLSTFWRSTAVPPSGFNASRYANPEVDRLIDRARSSLDPDEARGLWIRCQRIIYEDQPILFICYPYEVVGLDERFCNVEPNAHGFFVNLHEWDVGDNCASR